MLCSVTNRPPHRSKSSVKTHSKVFNNLSDVGEVAVTPEAVESLNVNQKLSKSCAVAAQVSTLPRKVASTSLTEKKISKTCSTSNVSEHWSLISMAEPEQVSSHPILKFVDFSLPIQEVDFSSVTNAQRFLAALRLCHKFAHGSAFIRTQFASLSGPSILEAARLLADAEIYRRCAVCCRRNEPQDDFSGICTNLLERFKSTHLPQSMTLAIKILLGCVIDPSRTVTEFCVAEMKQVIFRTEVHHHLACAALDFDHWNQFKWATAGMDRQRNVLEWYMSALAMLRTPLSQIQWSKYAANIIEVCGSESEPIAVEKDGRIKKYSGKKLQLSLPREEAFTQDDFLLLKNSMNGLVNQLSKGSGSVTKKELLALRQRIRSWSKGAEEPAVVIDSLNVFHGTANGFDPLVRLSNRLASEYNNAIVVTRPFLAEKLRLVRWRGNVHIFSCTSLSEDDLLVLLAAFEWGPNAYVLSNDRFGVHVDRANCTGRLSLQDWMRRRILRFNKLDWRYDCLPEYGEYVQQVTPKLYFVPILEETPGIPQRSARLVTVR